MRRHRHRFLPAGDDDVGVAGRDLLHADRDGAEPRAAELVQPPGRHFLRNARLHRRLPRRVLPLGGGQDLAQDDLGHLLRLHLGALERALDRDRAELVRGKAGESAVEGADRRARGAGDHDVCHGEFSWLASEPAGRHGGLGFQG